MKFSHSIYRYQQSHSTPFSHVVLQPNTTTAIVVYLFDTKTNTEWRKGCSADEVFNAVVSLAHDERAGGLLSDLVDCFHWSPLFMYGCKYDVGLWLQCSGMWDLVRIRDALACSQV